MVSFFGMGCYFWITHSPCTGLTLETVFFFSSSKFMNELVPDTLDDRVINGTPSGKTQIVRRLVESST
jgi:hypothetical protein